MPFVLADTARNAACNGIVDLIDAGAGAGTLVIFANTQPTNPQTAHGATGAQILATLTFSATAFGAAAAGQATANAITSDVSVDNTDTAVWARVYDGDGVDPTDAVFDMDILQGSGTLNLDNTSFVAGGTAAITSMQITVPAS